MSDLADESRQQLQPSVQHIRKGFGQSLTWLRLGNPGNRCLLGSSVLHRDWHWQRRRNRHWCRRHYRWHDDVLRLRRPPGGRVPMLDTGGVPLRGAPCI